jgi:hypothetical protein
MKLLTITMPGAARDMFTGDVQRLSFKTLAPRAEHATSP